PNRQTETSCIIIFLLSATDHSRYLHSFPTRRSSDLQQQLEKRGLAAAVAADETQLPAGVQLLAHVLKDGVEAGRVGKRQMFDLEDRKSTRLNSSHVSISYAVFCLKKKKSISIR